MIIYTDKFLKSWMGGRQLWFLAIVRPRHRGDQAIIEHERAHIKQWWTTTLLSAAFIGFACFVANEHFGVAWQHLAGLATLPPSLHGLLYLILRRYRLWAEVQAYRVSLAYRPSQLDHYSNALATKYRLKLMASEARNLLKP